MSESTPAVHPPRTRAAAIREELIDRIGRLVPTDASREALDGLVVHRRSQPDALRHTVAEPCFCVIASGAKEVRLGERTYAYDPLHYLLVTAELPLAGRVVEATPEHPYLSLRLRLDPTDVSAVLLEAGGAAALGSASAGAEPQALDVSPLGSDLLDATLRLVRLAGQPAEARVLGPLVRREIVYRLLVGAQGARLRHVAIVGGQRHRIARAVRRLRTEFDAAIPVEALAQEVGMSGSTFHRHFKAVTGLSPLQYQKQVRLQEARRMLGEGLDAATAGYRVGYNDPSQFGREYKRFFGQSPLQDAAGLRVPAA